MNFAKAASWQGVLTLWQKGRFPILLAVVLLLCYWPARHGEMVFDDRDGIVENTSLRTWRFWEASNPDSTPWGRPVVALTLWLNYWFSGLAPEGYRAVNLVIHWGAAMALASLVALTFRRVGVGGAGKEVATVYGQAAALLWALHPLCTATVSCIIQRAEGLMALCYILLILEVARAGERGSGWAWWPMIWSALGMMCKESMVTAPIGALLYDRAFLAKSWKEVWQKRWRIHLSTMAGWLILVACMWTWPRSKSVGWGPGQIHGPLEALFTHSGVIANYLWLAIWPEWLALDYDWPVARSAMEVWPWLCLVGGLFAGSVVLWFKSPKWGFCGVAFFLILAPTSSVVPVHTSLAAEHRMYLPLATLAALLIAGVAWLTRDQDSRWPLARRAFASWVCLGLLTVVFGILTAKRNFTHRTAEALWLDVLDGQPRNIRAWNNLGAGYMLAGRNAEARACLEKAMTISTGHLDVLYNLGLLRSREGNHAEAASLLERLAGFQPKRVDVLYKLGDARALEGRNDLAEAAYGKVLLLEPDHMRANGAMAMLRASQQQWEAALVHADNCLRLDPGNAYMISVRSEALEKLSQNPSPSAP